MAKENEQGVEATKSIGAGVAEQTTIEAVVFGDGCDDITNKTTATKSPMCGKAVIDDRVGRAEIVGVSIWYNHIGLDF